MTRRVLLVIMAITILLVVNIIPNAYSTGPSPPPIEPPMEASIVAMQNNQVISTTNPGVVGVDIDCVGGIKFIKANDFHCSLIDPNTSTVVATLSTTTSIPCPNGVFPTGYKCFKVTFDGSYFPTPATWTFNATFTLNGNTIDLVGPDFRTVSFLVLPETAIGAVAVLAATFGAFIAYSMRRR